MSNYSIGNVERVFSAEVRILRNNETGDYLISRKDLIDGTEVTGFADADTKAYLDKTLGYVVQD